MWQEAPDIGALETKTFSVEEDSLSGLFPLPHALKKQTRAKIVRLFLQRSKQIKTNSFSVNNILESYNQHTSSKKKFLYELC